MNNKNVETANITKSNFFQTAEAVNYTNKVFYSTCLDGKGNSKVFNTKEPADLPVAGAPSRIQKKAYRANT